MRKHSMEVNAMAQNKFIRSYVDMYNTDCDQVG